MAILASDPDPQETREWLEAIRGVISAEGPDRARQLIAHLVDEAQNNGAMISLGLTTPYVNTIPPDRQPPMPGDRDLEARLRHYVRWNALAMVVRANKISSELGGHVASFASAATLYDVGFNHFFRAPSETFGGDLVFFQGHSSPGVYARAFLEGRVTEDQLERFRQEVDGKGLSSYPHPWLMPDFWQFPTVSMGLGPIMSIYQARFMRYLHDRGLRDTTRRKVWAFVGDGETDEPESLGSDFARRAREARQPDLGRQLQPAAARRTGSRQRQDHSGARGRLQRRRLERHQGHLGKPLGSAARRRQDRPARAVDERVRRRRLPNVQVARRQVRPRRILRPLSRDARARRKHDRRRNLGAAARRPRSDQSLRGIQGRLRTLWTAHRRARENDQRLRNGRSRRSAKHRAPGEKNGSRGDARLSRSLLAADLR